MAPAAQLSCVLFSLVSISVSSDVVRLVGDSVQLDIQDPVLEFDDLFWVFNKTDNVIEYNKKYKDIKLSSRYKNRVEFNDKTYSLTLKNLQKNDSGLYEARASAAQVTVVAEYRLSVWDKHSQHWLWPVVGVLAGLIILIVIAVIINQKKSAGFTQQSENTLYAEVQQRSTTVEPNVSDIYETVPDQMQRTKPETIYGRVSKPSKPVNTV